MRRLGPYERIERGLLMFEGNLIEDPVLPMLEEDEGSVDGAATDTVLPSATTGGQGEGPSRGNPARRSRDMVSRPWTISPRRIARQA